jgi:putative alpha-1,2-mannosidase
MMLKQILPLVFLLSLSLSSSFAQFSDETDPDDISSRVNVFLGTSGDHGQLSPAASYPFSLMSIGPQTYPHLHAGYEYNAKEYLGFTHNRMEGVGCKGSGGNLLIKPFMGTRHRELNLTRTQQQAEPGYFHVAFDNGISAKFSVDKNEGRHHYQFPAGEKGFYIDLSHTLDNQFVAEEHRIEGNRLIGWVESKTTCNAGKFRLYYALEISDAAKWEESGKHQLLVSLPQALRESDIKVAFSSVSTEDAIAALTMRSLSEVRSASRSEWNKVLGHIAVEGDPEREKLFYSLLYRTVQSPYVISEKDGRYRGHDGSLQKSKETHYNGWAIWDNYRTQLPLLSLAWPEKYQGITSSIANLYRFGKKDYATQSEPSNTVRTEHAIVVLLDSYRKGYKVDFRPIIDSLIGEVERLDFSSPDKALESSYDVWALSEILGILKMDELSKKYKEKALGYREYWSKDFKDMTRSDVDRMQARKLYQGTIWQYRWFVPFDVKGLIGLIGGDEMYRQQLDYFFENDLYNHANEPDIQVPYMYNASSEIWKSQAMIHKYAKDTVVQYYFNDNSRGIDPFVDRIYKNQPKAFIRTMDDDAGAMSAWYVLAATGISPAVVGWPIYYLHVPLFESVTLNPQSRDAFHIRVHNFAEENIYIQSVKLNGKSLDRNYVTHEEVAKGGTLEITASAQPNKAWAAGKQWISELK